MNATNSSESFVVTVLDRQCGSGSVSPQLAEAFANPFALIVTSSLVPVLVAAAPV